MLFYQPFSGNRNLLESAETHKSDVGPLNCCNSNKPRSNPATASVTYQVRNGVYYEKCCWRKKRGNWRCIKKKNRKRKC